VPVPAKDFPCLGRDFGTCAGLILLASEVESPRQCSLGLFDATVERNAYGRQRESFEEHGTANLGGRQVPVEMIYIRAPRIRRLGPRVEVLATRDGEPVMAREGTILVATFHPELTDDPGVHRYFCEMVAQTRHPNHHGRQA
jgi:5'-phosphate synthase pdxT subunit